MSDHRLKSLELTRFKRFEHLTLEFGRLNLLVGPNNSGKSTVLEACALFDACYRGALERRDGELAFTTRRLADLAVVATAEAFDLWTRRCPEEDGQPLALGITAQLRSGQRYGFEIRWLAGRFTVEPAPGNPPPVAPDTFGVVFLSGYSGFWPREERRTPAVIRALREQGQHGVVLDLHRDAERWERFRTLLAEVFPQMALDRPRFDEQVDTYIRVLYSEPDAQPGVNVDLFSAGTGFHQMVQILGVILSESATTILLDEPDAHLFSRLQSRLYDLLQELSRSGRQVIAATHSTELIAAADPRQIISFNCDGPRSKAI